MNQNEHVMTTDVTDKDISVGIEDEYGIVYSPDGKLLLRCHNKDLKDYYIKPGTKVICDKAFSGCKSLQSITIPNSVTSICDSAFHCCI